ncbi:hypothetical protein K469DRAFT_187282 [Zopfia rhizophila CBS 207.26]|uniref:Uncharacterized protein n=1 Tax=Zopfia rhizophila CBS 207.26 TaxID=1314779 RepID=A0A6A6ERW4_9PEZI|nr:hypothetical protein K469DRAFT_187282 [Zopfia rhizophila CBS 207.26]
MLRCDAFARCATDHADEKGTWRLCWTVCGELHSERSPPYTAHTGLSRGFHPPLSECKRLTPTHAWAHIRIPLVLVGNAATCQWPLYILFSTRTAFFPSSSRQPHINQIGSFDDKTMETPEIFQKMYGNLSEGSTPSDSRRVSTPNEAPGVDTQATGPRAKPTETPEQPGHQCPGRKSKRNSEWKRKPGWNYLDKIAAIEATRRLCKKAT